MEAVSVIWRFTLWTLVALEVFPEADGLPTGRVVTMPQGRIKGRYSETRSKRVFTEFFGIPYAQPPKRFKPASLPAPKWNDTRNGTIRAKPCFQSRGQVLFGDEDCLTLSVHTPATHENFWLAKDLPVIVIFHGGSWMVDRGDWNGGSGDQFGAKHFMADDGIYCVIVTVNYRLGVFGFFSLFSADGPANLGLKDQVLALKWVRENIHLFGGDPNLVTILGQGAGGAAVGLHLMSPMSKGLFHRAILQSGSPLCHWALVDDRKLAGLSAFLQQLGCDSAADKTAVTCLEGKKPDELELARQKIMQTYNDPFHPFGPVIEHWVRANPKLKVFLPDYPINILSNQTGNDAWNEIPIIMGVNNQDGMTFVTGQYIYNPFYKDQYFTNYTNSFPPNFGYGLSSEKLADENMMNDVTEKIRNFYYENVPVEEMKNQEHHQTHIDMYSHRNYFQCVKNAAAFFAEQTDVYLYYWTRMGTTIKKWHDYDKLNVSEDGLANGDEVHFLFDTADDFGDYKLITSARSGKNSLSQAVVKVWYLFALTGNFSLLTNFKWTSMRGRDKGNLEYLEIKDQMEMIPEPFTKYTDFWDSLGLDEPRELPPPGELKKKLLGRKDSGDDGEGGGFIYIDIEGDDPQK